MARLSACSLRPPVLVRLSAPERTMLPFAAPCRARVSATRLLRAFRDQYFRRRVEYGFDCDSRARMTWEDAYADASGKPNEQNQNAATQTAYFSGTRTGAPLSFRRSTMNFAGCVWLALRPTVCTSFGPS